MRVVIITDLEGVSGVDHIDMVKGDRYAQARQLLTADTNAAIDGAFAGGADEVWVVDGHGGGGNFVTEDIDPRAKQIPCAEFCYGDLAGIDAAVSIGCHAMAGTEKAFLDHTQSSAQWFDFQVNGVSYGEIGQLAITGGAFGFPLVAVAGDEAACAEAEGLVEGIATAPLKYAEIRNQAICYPLETCYKRIYAAVKDGVERYREIAPVTVTLPATVAITYYRNDYCDAAVKGRPQLQRSGRTASKVVDTITRYMDVAGL